MTADHGPYLVWIGMTLVSIDPAWIDQVDEDCGIDLVWQASVADAVIVCGAASPGEALDLALAKLAWVEGD